MPSWALVAVIILERSVTKQYWLPMYDYILRRLNTGRFDAIPGTRVLHVHGGENTRTYAVLSTEAETRGLPAAWLYLGKRPGWAAWEVRQVWVFPDWRRDGLAKKIYQAAVNRDGILLASGKSQSKSARALWHRFVKDRTFNIWAQDFNNLDLTSDVFFEDDELQCNLELYTRWSCKHDVRLIAVKKGAHELHRNAKRHTAKLN